MLTTAIGPLRAERDTSYAQHLLPFGSARFFVRRKVGNIIQLIFYLFNFWHPLAAAPHTKRKLSLYKLTICFVCLRWPQASYSVLGLLKLLSIFHIVNWGIEINAPESSPKSCALFRNLADSKHGLRCEHKTEESKKNNLFCAEFCPVQRA